MLEKPKEMKQANKMKTLEAAIFFWRDELKASLVSVKRDGFPPVGNGRRRRKRRRRGRGN